MKKHEIYISGRVQGVGYRYFVYYQAQSYDIKGYVKNLMDERVKVIAIGENTKKFIEELRKGPMMSHVSDIQINELISTKEYEEFTVEY
ncbi:MAG: acylphosphatase [Armatimonadetes bacterium]|nr:acylphosphatase [Armatimonadota bacterium]